jgi:hypothetical protein
MAESSGTFTGGCLCGAVRFEARPPSRFCAHCHCGNCRRAHGAAFVTWAGFPRDRVRIVEGEETLADYRTDTGATRSFCGRCGTTMFYRGPRWEGELHVALAAINGPIDRAPASHVYVDHHAEWWTIDDGLPCYGGESGMEPKDG